MTETLAGEASKDASPSVVAQHAAVLDALPFGDTADFDDAARGFLGTIDNAHIATAQGRVVCAQAVFTDDHGGFDRWFYARIAGRLVGVARSAKWLNRDAINSDGVVKLRASRSLEGQVTVPSGFDPTKVSAMVAPPSRRMTTARLASTLW